MTGDQGSWSTSRSWIGVLALAVLLGIGTVARASGPRGLRQPSCATSESGVPASRAALPAGTLLTAQQDPAVVHYGYRGKLRYRDLAVLGDFDSVAFEIDSVSGVKTFSVERTRVDTNPQGDVISFFDLEGTLEEWVVLPFNWDADVASPILFSDLLYLGPPGSEQPVYMPIMVLPRKLPRSPVVRRNDRLQYASNVVNVAVPDLHQRQLDEPTSLGFSPEEVMDLVAEELGDFAYDEFGIGLWQHLLTNSGAFHQNNEGSSYPPYSFYASIAFPVFELWKHEIGHNWSFHYDLPRLVGWQVPFDGWHSRGTVAKEPGMLCCGAYPVRKVKGRWRTVWTLEPHPFHPLELFAMGLIGAGEVPKMRVFKRQDLPDYRPDEVMAGPSRALGVERVIEEYALPAPAAGKTWHVAPVIVSETLLEKRWLSALNFYLRRIEDPDGEVPESFDRSTRGLLDLQTTIEVSTGPRPRPPRDVVYPAIGKQEIPGVVLNRVLPGCLAPGQALVVSGRTISGTDPETLALVPSNPDTPPVEASLRPTGTGRFEVELTPTQEDVYRLLVGPVWPRQEPGEVTAGPIYVTTSCR